MTVQVSRKALTVPALHLFSAYLLCFVLASVSSDPLVLAQGGKVEVLPMQKAAPVAVAIETTGTEAELRRQMRGTNGVVELHSSTTRFSQAPTGSFGFIAPQFLGLALTMQSPDLAMERVSPAANAYEIHKLADGSGLLVGFMGKDLVPKVTPQDRPKNIRVSLYSSPSDQAPFIVALPLVKLMVDRMPTRINPKQPNSPVVLEMDLQGTANRKSTNIAQ